MRSRRGPVAAAVFVVVTGACGSVRHTASPAPSLNPSHAQASNRLTTPTDATVISPAPTLQPAACSNASKLAAWPLDRVAAQLVTAPVLNFDPAGVSAAVAGGDGGILFLGPANPPATLRNIVTSATPPAGTPAPLVMADEEGGAVQRLYGAVTAFPSARTLAATETPAQIEQLGRNVGEQMAAVGINTDLAPVLDLDAGPGPSATNPDGTRSYSANPAVAARDGIAMLDGLNSAGVLPVIKHFPGLGGATGNTDYGPAATQPVTSPDAISVQPFRAAIAAGAPAVMVTVASVPGLSSGPASLSAAVVTGLLRNKLGFEGLVLTDSLSAGAVTAAGYTVPSATVAAIKAGVDLILWGSTLTAVDTEALNVAAVTNTDTQIVAAITRAVQDGNLSRNTLEAAAETVLTAKHANLCITPSKPPDPPSPNE